VAEAAGADVPTTPNASVFACFSMLRPLVNAWTNCCSFPPPAPAKFANNCLNNPPRASSYALSMQSASDFGLLAMEKDPPRDPKENGESLPAPLPHPSGHVTGFILRPFATHTDPSSREGCPTAKVEARSTPSIGRCAWATLRAGRTRTRASQPAQPRDDYCGSGKASLVVMAKSMLRRQFRDGFEKTINRSGSPASAV
jgi:hypothetical protein